MSLTRKEKAAILKAADAGKIYYHQHDWKHNDGRL